MIPKRRRTIRLVAPTVLLFFANAATTNAFAVPQLSRRSNHVGRNSPLVPIRTQRQADTQLRSSLGQTISQLSKPASALTQLASSAHATPAIAYFLVLCAAGFGAPVSEDLLCIFAGTLLDKIQTPARRIRLITALYLGVVISDLITFSIGRMMKVGLLEPLRKRMNLSSSSKEGASAPIAGNNGEAKRLRKRDKVLQKLKSAGDWAGFYARLSVGFRPAMMILAGFSGKVSFAKYILGTAGGGVITLSAQLLLGYSMRHKPSDILAVSSKLLVVAPVTLITTFVVWLMRHNGNSNNNDKKPSSLHSTLAEENGIMEIVDGATDVNNTITNVEVF